MSTFFYKFKYENIIIMKNKPDPALLRTSYLSNEIEKMTSKSHETIPLNNVNFFYKFKYENIIKRKISLIRPYYELHIYRMK
jgi:hypothetical protein